MSLIYLFVGCYFLLLFSILGVGLIFQRVKEKTIQIGKKINCDQITLIIPFRNEEKRIDGIISSIKKSKKLPSKIVFVNDHSDDNSVAIIKEKFSYLAQVQILCLPNNLLGKKQAIRYGINQAKTEYILTLDADVNFESTYFEQLENLTEADLYLLPAVLKATRPIHHFFEIDLLLINAINTGINGLSRPIIASGANLLFNRQSFLEFDRFENHAHIPRGDDIYLLRDFRQAKCDIRIVAREELQVQTETPQSLGEFFHQRVRWIAKTGNVNDTFSTSLAIIQFVFILSFWAIEINLLIECNFKIGFLFFGIKTILDMLLFFTFFKEFKRFTAWLLIPIYQLIFPIYNLILLILLPFFKPVWKGRNASLNFRLQK